MSNVQFVKPEVTLIAHTVLATDDNGIPVINNLMETQPEATDMETLSEFAGRLCYQSYHRPNPATGTTDAYLRSTTLDKEHYSITEHATAALLVTGVSRALTHEWVRHRHFGYSQLSQRFVNESSTNFVLPPLYEDGFLTDEQMNAYTAALSASLDAYTEAVRIASEHPDAVTRKQGREAARSLLPNAVETQIVISGNMRAFKEAIDRRIQPDADAEIQRVAKLMKQALAPVYPVFFADEE